MSDIDDKLFISRIEKVVNGNAGISLEEIARVLGEPTDLVLNYIDIAGNVREYAPNKFKRVIYHE